MTRKVECRSAIWPHNFMLQRSGGSLRRSAQKLRCRMQNAAMNCEFAVHFWNTGSIHYRKLVYNNLK